MRTRVLLVPLLGVALLTPVSLGPAAAAPAPPTITSWTATIATPDGVTLAARVDSLVSSSPVPLMIMPDAWGQAPRSEVTLAKAGFDVVNYAQRGMGGSTGLADMAGAATQADFVTVLNWALANTNADATRIGSMGESYGADVALLGAAEDSRVKAVVAMSGWSDLSTAMAPGASLNTVALKPLLNNKPLTTDIATLRTDVGKNPAAALRDLSQLTAARSPASVVGQLNARAVPVLLAGALEDSIIPASELASLYSALTGPKRLFLVQGDHSGIASAQGFASNGPEWGGVYWLQHYVEGLSLPASDFTPNIGVFDERTGQLAAFSTWPAAAHQLFLTGTGAMAPAPDGSTGWTSSITANVATPANSAPPDWGDTAPYVAPTVTMSSIPAADAATWTGPIVSAPTQICGSPQLALTVSGSATSLSVFAYLYDVNNTGTGTLLSSTPDSLTGLTPGTPVAITLPLQPICTTLAAGDQLDLVIGTKDTRYAGVSVTGSTVTFSSSPASTAALSY